jgi:hypothetical protein
MQGHEYLTRWGLLDPKMVGASEYSAVYELLSGALTNCEEEVCDEPAEFADAILREVILHAQAVRKLIKKNAK